MPYLVQPIVLLFLVYICLMAMDCEHAPSDAGCLHGSVSERLPPPIASDPYYSITAISKISKIHACISAVGEMIDSTFLAGAMRAPVVTPKPFHAIYLLAGIVAYVGFEMGICLDAENSL